MEGGGAQHRKLPVDEADEAGGLLDVGRDDADALIAVEPVKDLARTVDQGHPVVGGRGQ